MKKKKFVFVVRCSEDGIMDEAYTNVKVLYNFLASLDYGIQYIGYSKEDEDYAKFNYVNLLKEINKNENNFIVCYISCSNDANIQIMKLNIISK